MCWMPHMVNSAVKVVMISMEPQWNITESLPTTSPHLTSRHISTPRLSSFTRLWHQEVLQADFQRGWYRSEFSLYLFLPFLTFRESVCTLCCGCESFSCIGPSLPDDSSSPQSVVLYTLCAAEALDFSQQRLPATAHRPGPKTAGWWFKRARVRKPETTLYFLLHLHHLLHV